MKFFHCLFILLVSCGSLAQQSQTMLVIEYDFYINIGNPINLKSSLYINGNERLFIHGKNDAELIEEEMEQKEDGSYSFSITLFDNDSIGPFNYINISNDTIISRWRALDKKVYFVQEEITKIKWEISEETQKIGSIACQKATGNFRGRNYEVWFAPQFPINAGPWKLSGLPGIILKVADNAGKVQIVFSEIRKEEPSLFPTINIDTSNLISIEQFAKLQESIGDDLAKKIMSKMPRGAKVESTTSESLEIFNDEN